MSQKKIDYVNPMIGTAKMGHTFPGACAPHGMVQLSPDTENIPQNIDGVYQKDTYKYCAGYQHSDSTIVGFSHTHLSGTGHSDLGDILIMPITGKIKLTPGVAEDTSTGYRSKFSHDTEVAKAGYYKVDLDDYGVKAEFTATERIGVHKYTFPKGEQQQIILDLIHGIYNYDGKVLWSSLRVENDSTITGFRLTNGWAKENYLYFAIRFSKPILSYGYEDLEKPKYIGFWRKFKMDKNFPEIGGRKIVTYFDFGTENTPLEIEVALSAVNASGALKNLVAETEGKGFDKVLAETSDKWEKELEIIDAKGTQDELTMLYTSLYHTLINPSVYMDVDGKYRGLDHEIHQADGFTNYTIFSLWDTYRALHPLFNIIARDKSQDMVNSMLAHYEQSVHKALPVWSLMGNENWCMIGYHGVSVVGDALNKGLNINKEKALEAMLSSANLDYYDGTKEYKQYGYVPYDVKGTGSSITLEYAYDDWVIYNTLMAMGKVEEAKTYKNRAENYRNVFDPEIGFVRAKYKDGKWKSPYNLLQTHDEGFIEGNSWNYSFYVPQDVNGLISEMGGDKVFVERLDSIFTMHLPDEFFADTEDVTREGVMGNYVHGNEPSHHIPYLYAWTSQPWKSQYWIREIMEKMYLNKIDGLCGNDDSGQMSAWYIFSAMGFYPVCPGSDQYVLGAPYLPYMKVSLGNGKYLTVKADKINSKNRYVKTVKLNGKIYDKAYITYNDIKDGAVFDFEMSSSPNKKRLFDESQKAYSLTASVKK